MRAGNIFAIIRRLKARKALERNKITNQMLKKFNKDSQGLSRKGVAAITNIANSILQQGYSPFLNKAGNDAKLPQNYHPISFLQALCKVAARTIFWNVREETNDLDSIPPEKFRSRIGHSYEFLMLRLVEMIMSGFNNRGAT